MKTFFILAFVLYFLSSAFAQQTIDKLNTNQLKLPKESVNKALILDGLGQVKSSSTVTDTEVSYLDGLTDTIVNLLSGKEPSVTSGTASQYYRGDKTFQTLDKSAVGLNLVDNTSDAGKPVSTAQQTALNLKADNSVVVKLTGNQSISDNKTFTGKIVASTTANGSIPCPVMNQTQRNAFTASQGDCVYNTTSLQLNIYDGSIWKSAGGSGGISLWLTGTVYAVNDVVIQSDKIYRCLIAHTSGTFATDLSSGNWTEVSASPSTPYSLANGGTNKALTAVNGGIVWVDADSFEILSAGVSGQVLQSNGAGSPSFVNKSISAKSQNNSAVTAEEIQVPNNLLTQTDTNKHLNETGNKNILSNPSFEHSTFSTSWTNSAGTFTQELTTVIDGKASSKLVLSSQTMSLTQSSTLYQSNFSDGVQGLASVRVKSDVALKVCSIQAGTVSTTNCVDVQANNKWGLYKVPMILGAISNGISIASTGAVSGSVYIDDAFVGAVDLQATVDSTKMAGEAYFAGTTSCTWSRTSTTIGAFTATAACPGPTIAYSSLGQWQTTDSDLPRVTVNNLPAGVYKATFIYNSSVTAGAVSSSAINDGTSTCYPSPSEDSASASSGQIVSCTFTYASSGNRSFELYGATASSTMNVINSSTTPPKGTKFQLEYFGSGSVYSSTNADTDWASCGHTTSSFTGFGTVSAIETQCKRQGGDLLMKGKFTSGTPTAVEARLSLPVWNGVQLVSAGSSVIPSLQIAGSLVSSFFSATYFSDIALIEPSVSYMTMGVQVNTQSAITKATGAAVAANANSVSFNARIPIEGWQNSNIIIGQFNGLQSCTDTLSCTDTFSAQISTAGVVSNENVDFISGNCTHPSLGSNSCTFKTGVFTVAPNCVATASDRNNITGTISTATTVAANTANRTGGAIDDIITLVCQKQGADYVGRTALAVASDQNVRSIGAVGVDMQSVYFASTLIGTACTTTPCTIHRQVGSKITSVTRNSAGDYRLNGIDGTKYQCTGTAYNNVGANRVAMLFDSTSSTSSYANVSSQGVDTSYNSIICIGIP